MAAIPKKAVTVSLTPELHQAAQRTATRKGVSLSYFVEMLLRGAVEAELAPPPPPTPPIARIRRVSFSD